MDKLVTKRHTVRQARVALKHLAKAEPQKAYPKRKLRPLSETERAEILNRVLCGEALRKIVSEMGIPYALAFRLLAKNGITLVTGEIQKIRVLVEDDKALAVLLVDGIQFVIKPATYAKFVRVIDRAYIENLPLFLVAEYTDVAFNILHLALAKDGQR